MTVELITGHAGSAHISADDDGLLYAGVVGSGKYVLDTGNQLAATVQSANSVQIATGDALFEGRHVRVSAAETVAIDNGAQGMNRNDLICIKYERDSGTGVETASLAVIKGTATSGTASDPAIPSGSIIANATTAYMALWRIPISGVTPGTPESMFGSVLPNLNTAATGSVDASRLTGTISTSRIPNLAASKITSGTFDAARIPSLDAAKIASGTLDAARIPNLSASKITSGTLGLARGGTGVDGTSRTAGTFFAAPAGSSGNASFRAIVASDVPNIGAGKITSGTLDAARIPSLSATKITSDQLGLARMPFYTLYNDGTGTTGDITLSDSAANYTYMEIFYRSTNDNIRGSVKVYSPNGKYANMNICSVDSSGHFYIKTKTVSISGTTITQYGYAGYVDATTGAYTAENGFYIFRVIGWK